MKSGVPSSKGYCSSTPVFSSSDSLICGVKECFQSSLVFSNMSSYVSFTVIADGKELRKPFSGFVTLFGRVKYKDLAAPHAPILE